MTDEIKNYEFDPEMPEPPEPPAFPDAPAFPEPPAFSEPPEGEFGPEHGPRSPQGKVFGQLMKLNRLMMMAQHERMAHRGPAADPSRGQGRVLALLQVKDGLATRDMANILAIRPSSLNETLARLERDGLITRKPNEADKRQQLAYLTDEGRAKDTRPVHPHEELFKDFSDEELEQFADYLKRTEEALLVSMPPEAKERLERGRRGREEFFGRGPREGHRPDGPHGERGRHGEHGNCDGRGPRDEREPRFPHEHMRRG